MGGGQTFYLPVTADTKVLVNRDKEGFHGLSSAIKKIAGNFLKLGHGRFFLPQMLAGTSECVRRAVSLYLRNLSSDINDSR